MTSLALVWKVETSEKIDAALQSRFLPSKSPLIGERPINCWSPLNSVARWSKV